jgi:hypothetical protein
MSINRVIADMIANLKAALCCGYVDKNCTLQNHELILRSSLYHQAWPTETTSSRNSRICRCNAGEALCQLVGRSQRRRGSE